MKNSDEEDDGAYDAAVGHTASTAADHDGGETFDISAWAAEVADEDIDPEVLEELVDLEVIREEQGEVTDEILRRHVASVKQLYQMFGYYHSGEDSKF